ncbi:MAG: aminopeptidase [Candidatus Methanofastidiosa archaeon]|nr:aminopeptidase [Candidatus Methanofastidiosa archaeon]
MLEDACRNILTSSMALKGDETCLVVTDWKYLNIGSAFARAANGICKESLLLLMKERGSHGEEPPKIVAEAMREADVILMPTYRSLSHTRARKEACMNGARVASMPQITEDILSRTSGANFEQMRKDCGIWAKLLSDARVVRVVTAKGTDVSFSVDGREGQPDDGIYSEKGSFGNIPAGEVFIAPVEGTAEGTIVVDGSMAVDPGLLEEPIFIRMEEGHAIDIKGGKDAKALLEKISPFGRNARNLAEFAIGTNSAAKLTGNPLEDEKVKGTIHMALGDNSTFGGTVESPSHIDGIILEPTVFFDGRKIIDRGMWNI